MPFPAIPPAWTMIGLDLLMIVYSLWALSTAGPLGRAGWGLGCGLFAWLALLHTGLARQAIFPDAIPGPVLLAIIVAAVGAVGAALLAIPSLRHLLLGLDQRQLLLLQGVRVFFGAGFLVQAGTGVLPQGFGILDGITHIGAGFFGLVAAFSWSIGADRTARAWFANLFGLADILIVASTLALVLLPQIGPHHSMMYAVFLPAPLWLWFHLISIWKLLPRRQAAAGHPSAREAPAQAGLAQLNQ